MLIVCPSCGTSYDVKSANMPPTGRQVRCLRCRTVWHAEPSRADKVLAAAAAIGPDRDVMGEASGLAERAASQVASDSLASAAGDDTQPAEDQPFASATTGEGDPEGFPDEPDDAAEVQAPPIAPDDFEARPPIDVDDDDHADHRAAPPEDIETVAARQQRRSAAPTGAALAAVALADRNPGAGPCRRHSYWLAP